MERLQEKLEKTKRALTELIRMEKGHGHTDLEARAKELCSSLGLPVESWGQSRQPWEELESILQQLAVLDITPRTPPEHVSSEEVLLHASGGLALEGVFKTGKLEDMLEKRQQLIEAPKLCRLKGPEQGSFSARRDFSTLESQTLFQKIVERLGFSSNCAVSTGVRGVSLAGTIEKRNSEEFKEKRASSCEVSYKCTTVYKYIPLASAFIAKEQVKLSTAALRELQNLEKILLNISKAQKTSEFTAEVRQYFERFGSHVNQGPFYFGGRFCWKAAAEGIMSNELTEVEGVMSQVLSAYIGFRCSVASSLTAEVNAGFRSSELKEFLSGGHSEALLNKIQLSVSKTGGPAETDNYLQWRSALVSSNRTWCVIDRGVTLIPVWEIILSAHRKDFKDVTMLSNNLRKAYMSITNLSPETLWGENVLSAVTDVKNLLCSMRGRQKSDSEARLKELLEFKIKLYEKTGSHAIWVESCLSDKVFQDFLLQVTQENEHLAPAETTTLRALMCDLIEPYLFQVKSFPGKAQILKWAHQSAEKIHKDVVVAELSHFIEILKTAKEETRGERFSHCDLESVQEAKIKATLTVLLSLNSLLRTQRETNQYREEMLILSIVNILGYSARDGTFSHLLGWAEIDFIEETLPSKYNQYIQLSAKSADRALAFLWHLALSISSDGGRVSYEEKGRRLEFFKAHFRETPPSDLSAILDCDSPRRDWERIEKELHSIVLGTEKNEIQQLDKVFLCAEIRFSESSQEGKRQLQVGEQEDKPSVLGTRNEEESIGTQPSGAGEKAHNFMKLLERLGLQKFYSVKLTKPDVLAVNKLSLSNTQPTAEEELSFYYLYKLMMLDYRARSVLCLKEKGQPHHKSAEVSCDVDDFLSDTNVCDDDTEEELQIHPMDIQMAVFLCASDFLRQWMCTKLTKCQYALPLLVPDPRSDTTEFPVWAFQQVKKSWKSKGADKDSVKSGLLLQASVPIVSFIRFGICPTSKSKILNSVIYRQKHDVFFHRHCKGSTRECLLMDGLVEIAWYWPGGMEDDVLNSCVAFTNLHGDASDHKKQIAFLQEVSAVIVVLLSESSLNDTRKETLSSLLKSSTPVICLFAEKEKVAHRPNPTKVKLAVHNKNEAQLTDEIISHIKHFLGTNDKKCSLKACIEVARRHSIVTDEVNEKCREGHEIAQRLMDLIKKEKPGNVKNTFLPLQGDLWYEWCRKDKESYRLQSSAVTSIEQQKSQIQADKQGLRKQQLDKAFPLNNLMRSFLECLGSSSLSPDTKLYMLQWLGTLLDDLTTDSLTKLQARYHSTWVDMKSQRTSNRGDESQSKAEEISQKLDASNFGLQHLLREVSQIYEALKISPDMADEKQYLTALPGIGAEMLIAGYPLELMDGDASYVPLGWIEAVLDKLIHKVGDKQIFVLSILGVQSSGKSTLLNTMFGLHFPVSAGRCTRGAFMQLVTVDQKIRDELQYDFVLIVDTEGLRSPEINNATALAHDNELATFIVGIADATLINIMGESLLDMQDILQICVQAFMRMKRVSITPSCLFVHQNVAETSARFDAISFNDIIQFDVRRHVYFFKNLFEGNPSTAPPNPSYSENVQELKSTILGIREWKSDCRFASISEMKLRIVAMWNALLGENFVFSFRNSLEVMVYKRLEVNCGNWTWQLRKCGLDLQGTLRHQIMSDQVQAVDRSSIKKSFEQQAKAISEETEEYFKKEKYPHILNQWKNNIDFRLQTVEEELIEDTQRRCNKWIAQRKSRSGLDQKKSQYLAELLAKCRCRASNLISEPDETMDKEQVITERPQTFQFDEKKHIYKKSKYGILTHSFTPRDEDSVTSLSAMYEKISIRIAAEMKSTHPAFNSNRSNLENHLLIYLAEKERFDLYVEYFVAPKDCFDRYITDCVEEYCKRSGRERIPEILTDNLTYLIDRIIFTVFKVTGLVEEKQGNVSMWLDEFCSELGSDMDIPRNDFRTIEKEDIDLHGCWEQCPLCCAVCTNSIPDHSTDHCVQLHRPRAVNGWFHHGTQNFSVEICTTSVCSDGSFLPNNDESRETPWRRYREAGPPFNRWRITPDNSAQMYWKWFICAFKDKLEERYSKTFQGKGEIPEYWKTIDKKSAIEELKTF
ncbi:GVIN1 GTPase, partial [Atractosteus spatula]|nr:GVIN1 GTPase [Atractosteus spatula]